MPISTPAVRVGRDRSGRLLDASRAAREAVGKAVSKVVGIGGEDDFMYGADDSGEYNNPDYLELSDYVGDPNNTEVEPSTLETLYVNNNNDVVLNPEEFQ